MLDDDLCSGASGPCCTPILDHEPMKGYLSNLQEIVSDLYLLYFFFHLNFGTRAIALFFDEIQFGASFIVLQTFFS